MSHKHTLEKEGPGTWYSLHLQSKRAIDIDKKKSCLEFINSLREEFFCLTCKNHFNDFCEKNPPPNINNSNPKDFFIWSVKAHNNANKLTGKPEMLYQDAEKLYYDFDSVCSIGCGEENITKNPPPPKPFTMAARNSKPTSPKRY
jgi:hypothetical protein